MVDDLEKLGYYQVHGFNFNLKEHNNTETPYDEFEMIDDAFKKHKDFQKDLCDSILNFLRAIQDNKSCVKKLFAHNGSSIHSIHHSNKLQKIIEITSVFDEIRIQTELI